MMQTKSESHSPSPHEWNARYRSICFLVIARPHDGLTSRGFSCPPDGLGAALFDLAVVDGYRSIPTIATVGGQECSPTAT